MSDAWPSVELDHVERLRVLARVLPGVAIEERVIDAPFERVWGFVSDLERAPEFDTDLRRVRILRREGDRLLLRGSASWRWLGVSAAIDVQLREGWCWMHTWGYVVGMAAVPEGDRTRFCHMEGVHIPGPWLLRLLARPVEWLSRARHRLHIPRDVDGIERCLGLRP